MALACTAGASQAPAKTEAAAVAAADTPRMALVRRMLEGDGATDTLFARDHVSRKPWEARAAAAKGAAFDLDRVLSDLQVTVLNAVEGKDEVWVRWRVRGRWTGDFAGVKPTGRPIDVTGVNIYRFKGDKIVETLGEFDFASAAQQALGGRATAEQCQEALEVVSRPGPEHAPRVP